MKNVQIESTSSVIDYDYINDKLSISRSIWLFPKGNKYVAFVHFRLYNIRENPAFEFAILIMLFLYPCHFFSLSDLNKP